MAEEGAKPVGGLGSLRLLRGLLTRVPGGWAPGLLGLTMIASLTEGFGLLLLVPMLGLMSGETSINSPLVRQVLGLFESASGRPSLEGLLGVFFALVLFRSLIQYGRDRLGAALQYEVVDALRQQCFAGLLHVEWRWITGGRQSDHASLLLTDVSRIGVGLHFALLLMGTLASGLAYVGVALALSWPMTMVALLSGGLMLGALSGHRRAALLLGQKLGKANQAMQGNVQESLAGIKLTKIFGTEPQHLAHFMATTRRLREEQLHFLSTANFSRGLFQVVGGAMLAGYVYLGLRVWEMPLPELLVLVAVFGRLVPLFMSAHQHYYSWLHGVPAMVEVEQLMAACRQAAEPAATDPRARITVAQAITLEDVSVCYPERSQPALAAVSLRIPARATTAIVGASGAGKSTLADVLTGLLYPDTGRLCLDGEALAPGSRKAWRHSVAYVPQEVFLFHDSIRQNLLWAAPEATEDDLRQALARAAAEFVHDLPQGMETRVGDGGMRLSGGERQRIALARALLSRPSLLILDEATSALDVGSEARIREAIESLHGDLTMVLIGHRLATLEHADQVVVMEAGRVAAVGSWQAVKDHLPG